MRDRTRAMAAAVGLLVVVAGVPWLLYALGGGLPTSLPNSHQVHRFLGQPITDTAILRAVSIMCWAAWTLFAVAVAAEAVAYLRGRPSPAQTPRAFRIPGLQGPAGALFMTAVLLLPQRTAVPVAPTRAPVSLAAPAAFNLAAPRNDTLGIAGAVTTAEIPDHATPLSLSAWTPYTIQRYDTLWAIAETHLGDPLRWREIKDAAGHTFATGTDTWLHVDGRAIDEAQSRTIYPGEIVYLPPNVGAVGPVDPASIWRAPATGAASAPSTSRAEAADPIPPSRIPPMPDREGGLPAVAAPSHVDGGQATHGTSTAWVNLASGSRVGGAFAAGVLAALAAGRLRRRRAYRPGPPQPGLPLAAPPPPGLVDLLGAIRTTADGDEMPTHTVAKRPLEPLTVLPEPEARLRPDLIEIASRADETVTLALCDWPDLTVIGPGAEAALRAWVGAILVRNSPYGADILAEASIYDRLFPSIELPSLQRVTDVEDLLNRLEAHIVARTRRLEEADISDVATYRHQHPAEPFPLLVAVADQAADSHPRRWSALANQAARLGLTTITLRRDLNPADAAPATGPSVWVAADGTIEHATPEPLAEHLAGGRLFQISAAEGADLLRPVATVHNDETPVDEMINHVTNEQPAATSTPVAANGQDPPRPSDEATTTIWPTPSDDKAQPRPIRVRLLGPAEVEAWGQPITRGLRSSAYELLAFYALRPQGATAETAIDAIWPDANLQRGRERFWTALGNLRSRLRGPAGESAEILTKVGDHYRPDTTRLDIDVWRFEAALAEAVGINDSETTIKALETAVAAYSGDLTPNLDNLWIEPTREDLHRRAIDAHVRLADLYQQIDSPEQAIHILERAIELDPICEAVYRQLITLQANLGRLDAAQRTWRLLQARLAELDLEPEPETTRLAHKAATLTADPSWRQLQSRR
jgi:DNA-binding SARP family transcriptional activator